MDVSELDRRFIAAVASFEPAVRSELARILEMPDEARAAEIGGLHERFRGSQLVELLIDLEEDERIRRLVLAELHNQLRDRR